MINIKKKYRDLDDQGQIYSLSRNMNDTSIFRFSVVLKNKIEPRLLEQAVILALEKYKAYKVKMKAGIFGYYLEENKKIPVVEKAKRKMFRRINVQRNNEYLFKVTYENKKINIEVFHPLTDGNGGGEFFKEIIIRYLELRHPTAVSKNIIESAKTIIHSENAYTKNYKKRVKQAYNPPQGYMLKGKKLSNYDVALNHFSINLSEIKALAKQKECTLSELLVSMLIYSIYKGNYIKSRDRKPINVCLPVDLRKYFPTTTISNFISYIVVSLKLKKNKKYTFDEILEKVSKEFKNKLKLASILETMTANGKVLNNPIVKSVPLVLKRMFVVLGTLSFKKKFSTTVSNIGEFKLEKQYQKYIQDYHFVLSPDWSEKLRCGVVSYNQNIVMTFGTNILESNIEKEFKYLLDSFKLKYKITDNGLNKIA